MRGQRPGSPFIEEPDEIEAKEGDACWLNHARICGPDCIAHNIDSFDEAGFPVQGPTQCSLIVLAGQLASGVTALVQLKKQDTHSRRSPPMPTPPKVGT
jgi:hypothetical protein